MKANLFFTIIVPVVLLFTHCTIEEGRGGKTPFDEGEPVRFSAGLPDTRVSNPPRGQSKWDKGDTIGVYMVDGKSPFSSTSILEANKAYRTDVGGTTAYFAGIDSANMIRYPQSTTQMVHFYAYYPYASSTTSSSTGIEYAVTLPQIQDSLVSKTLDVLYSGEKMPYYKGNSTVALKFSHRMAKLVFNISDQSSMPGDFSSGLELEIKNVYEKGTLSLIDGSLTPASVLPTFITKAYVYVTPGDPKTAIAEALVIPMDDITVDIVTLTFTKDPSGAAYSFEAQLPPVTGSKKLESGNRYIYNVSLKDRNVSISGSIEDWNNQTGPPIEPS
jgi:hypothetical protein